MQTELCKSRRQKVKWKTGRTGNLWQENPASVCGEVLKITSHRRTVKSSSNLLQSSNRSGKNTKNLVTPISGISVISDTE
jgi:hypothetical protein